MTQTYLVIQAADEPYVRETVVGASVSELIEDIIDGQFRPARIIALELGPERGGIWADVSQVVAQTVVDCATIKRTWLTSDVIRFCTQHGVDVPRDLHVEAAA